MILKLVSSPHVSDFNTQVEKIIENMSHDNYILVNSDFKPIAVASNLHYSVLLYFANPYKEQSQLSSLLPTSQGLSF